jgi:radical SAM protein with 4Fe4S-binding SPASM domain
MTKGIEPQVGAVSSSVQRWAHDNLVPLNACIEITKRCNIRCLHCYNFDRDMPRHQAGCGDAADKRELSTAEILKLMTDLRAAGCLFLALTGGEALVHPDLFTFIAHAGRLNMAVQLLTNGVLLRPGMVAELARHRNLLGVSTSLYGATAEVHDGITQVAGSFDRTWAGAERLRAKGISVKLKFLVMRQNVHQVAEMIARAEERGFTHNLHVTVTARHDGSRTSLDTRIDEAQLEAVYRGPMRHLLRTGPIRLATSTDWSCNCARGNCGITAEGDVLPCISVPLVAGNIRDKPFVEIWRTSPVFQRIRGLRLEDYPQCSPCPDRLWCEANRGAGLTYTGSYTGVDPLVCARAKLAHRISDEEAAGPGST